MKLKIIILNGLSVVALLVLPLMIFPLGMRFIPRWFDNIIGLFVIGALILAAWGFVFTFMIPLFGQYSDDPEKKQDQKKTLNMIIVILLVIAIYYIFKYYYPAVF